MNQKFPPRAGDLPRDELCRRAQMAIEDSSVDVDVYFKFTCPECGERCTLCEPNKLYENGECHACGTTSPITVGGFSLYYMFGKKKDEDKKK